MNIRRFVTLNMIFIFFLASCEAQPAPTPTPQPPSPTATPTPAPSPTPVDYTIRVENVSLIEELGRLGRGNINSLTVTPDGEELVIISSIGLWIYSLESGELIQFVEGYPPGGFVGDPSIGYPTWSPDGQMLVVPLQLGGVWIFDSENWNVITDKELASDPQDLVTCVSWSPDGQLLAMDGEDGAVLIWSRTDDTWETLPSIVGTDTCVSWTDQDQIIVLGEIAEGENRGIFDARTGKLLKTISLLPGNGDFWSPDGEYILTRHPLIYELFQISSDQIFIGGFYSSFAWSPDGINFAAGPFPLPLLRDTPPVLVNLKNEVVTNLSPINDEIVALTWTPDGKLLGLSQKDIGLSLWKYTTGKELVNLAEHITPPWELLQTDDSSILFSNRSAIEEWDFQDNQLLKSFGHENMVVNAKISHDQDVIISMDMSGKINIWDVSGYMVHTIEGFLFSDLNLSPDGKFLTYLDKDLSVCIWDLRWGEVIEKLEVKNFPDKLSWSPTSERLFIQYQHDLWVVSVDSEGISLDLQTVGDEEFFWGPEGELFKAETRNDFMRISNADSGEHLFTADPGELLVSPDGMKLVVPKTDEATSSFLIYELENGNQIGTVRMYSGDRLAWSPDGSLIAIFTQEHNDELKIIIVDANTAEKIAEIKNDFPVNELIWTENGTKIFFSDEAGIIHVWGLP